MEDNIWFQIIHHMIGKQQQRVIVQTLIMLQKSALLNKLCFGLFGGDILSVLAGACGEAVHRVEQVRSLLPSPPPFLSDLIISVLFR